MYSVRRVCSVQCKEVVQYAVCSVSEVCIAQRKVCTTNYRIEFKCAIYIIIRVCNIHLN